MKRSGRAESDARSSAPQPSVSPTTTERRYSEATASHASPVHVLTPAPKLLDSAPHRHAPTAGTTTRPRRSRGDAQLEGGDILVIGNRTVMIGMGERSRPAAVEIVAQRLFAAEVVDRVIAVVMPAHAW